MSLAIHKCRKITIAAVNGHAVGIGVTGFQLPCDFRLVWEGAKLALPFTRRGISPEASSTYFLPRLLGHSRASALLLTGGTFSPTSPLLSGLYHSVHPTREEVFPAALALAKDLAENTSATSVAATKALLWRGSDSPEGQHLLDSRSLGELAKLTDANEGAVAFKERRKPVFKDTVGDMKEWYPWVNLLCTQIPPPADCIIVDPFASCYRKVQALILLTSYVGQERTTIVCQLPCPYCTFSGHRKDHEELNTNTSDRKYHT